MDTMALGGSPASKGAKSAPAPSGGSMAKADPGRHKPLGQVLKEMELVSEGQIQEALQIQRKQVGVPASGLRHPTFVIPPCATFPPLPHPRHVHDE